MKNLKMNDQVFQLRRNVIALIYEAKKLVPSLPRIQVRITEDSKEVNGVAVVSGFEIYIPANSAGRTKDQLRRTVFHEILHAAYGVRHHEKCNLMSSCYRDLSKDEADRLFVMWAHKIMKEKDRISESIRVDD